MDPESLARDLGVPKGKVAAYLHDPYFVEGLTLVDVHWGPDVASLVRRLAVVVFKPDAIISQRVHLGLELLRQRGYAPLAVHPVRITKHLTRGLWIWPFRTDFGPYDRLRLAERFLGFSDSVFVLLGVVDADDRTGTERLFDDKGAADPRKRSATSIRAQLGSPNRYLTLIHSADDAADMIRELTLLLPASTVATALCTARRWRRGPATEADDTQIAAALSGYGDSDEPRDLHLEGLLRDLVAEASGVGNSTLFAQRIERALASGPLDEWISLVTALEHEHGVSPWTVIGLTMHYLCRDVELYESSKPRYE